MNDSSEDKIEKIERGLLSFVVSRQPKKTTATVDVSDVLKAMDAVYPAISSVEAGASFMSEFFDTKKHTATV